MLAAVLITAETAFWGLLLAGLWSRYYRHLLAYAIGAGLLLAAIGLVADAERTEALLQMLRVWTLVLAIDFLVSFSYSLWPRGECAPKPS